MKVRPLKQAQQRDFDFYRLLMDHYILQIECSTLKDEPENRLNIIFPSGTLHYQVTTETYKDKITREIYKKENKDYFFFEIVSKKEYSRYLEEESSGIFDTVRDDYHIYVFFFRDDVIEIVTYDEPIFVYSYTGEYEDIGY